MFDVIIHPDIRVFIAPCKLGLDLAKTQGTDTVTLDKSRSALAEYFGVARPSLEREITHLDQMGITCFERHTVTITDRRRLVKLING